MKAAVLLLTLAASSAQAQFIDGNELLTRMGGSPAQVNNSIGYIMGVADAHLNGAWCPPPNVTGRQVFDLTKGILEAVPEKRHENASAFVIAAVKMTFPCKPKQDVKPAKGAML